jgi:hypothetical protein
MDAVTCPFHADANNQATTIIAQPTIPEEQILQVDVSDPDSLDAFLKTISSLDSPNRMGDAKAKDPQKSSKSTSESGSMSEADLLRLAEEVDRWMAEDRR